MQFGLLEDDMRYIDADKIVIEDFPLKDHEIIKVNSCMFVGRKNGKSINQIKDYLKNVIENVPTEDVVPRSEYEKMQKTAEHQQSLAMERWFENNRLKRKIDELEKEVAREIFEELEKNPVVMKSCIFIDKKQYTELKKKYIGE